MLREELDELTLLIQDLRMVMDVKAEIDAGEERGLVDFADGTSIKVPIPDEVKGQLEDKIAELTKLIGVRRRVSNA